MSRGTILIVGASVRAAAMSARRAGYQPFCIDLFADRDLRRIAECQRIGLSDYPTGLGRMMQIAPPGPWMYTGGLENHAELIDEWRRERSLLGNGRMQLRRARDPFWLSHHLFSRRSMTGGEFAEVSMPYPRCVYAESLPAPPPVIDRRQNDWLVKPLRGAGGTGIERWNGQPLPPNTFLQRFVPGESVSAVFVASGECCRFAGSTMQLVGKSWLNAQPSSYCGSIGPRRLTSDERLAWLEVGELLTKVGGVRGVFGVDAILNDSGLTVVEVNPRYPASAEVLELASSHAILGEHDESSFAAQVAIGKSVYYAPFAFQFPESGPWDTDLQSKWISWRVPNFADIPSPGERFQRCDPVITVFATGHDVDQCELRLRQRSHELAQRFSNCSGVFPEHLG
jgi:predicted ATP-grasp superfamily ATP-dependent carboligase